MLCEELYLQRKQDGSECHGRGPLVLQNIETDGPSHARNVWVPDLRHKPDLERVQII